VDKKLNYHFRVKNIGMFILNGYGINILLVFTFEESGDY
jgi:hypothetical protein